MVDLGGTIDLTTQTCELIKVAFNSLRYSWISLLVGGGGSDPCLKNSRAAHRDSSVCSSRV